MPWRWWDAVEMGGNRQDGQKLWNPRISFPRELNLRARVTRGRSVLLVLISAARSSSVMDPRHWRGFTRVFALILLVVQRVQWISSR